MVGRIALASLNRAREAQQGDRMSDLDMVKVKVALEHFRRLNANELQAFFTLLSALNEILAKEAAKVAARAQPPSRFVQPPAQPAAAQPTPARPTPSSPSTTPPATSSRRRRSAAREAKPCPVTGILNRNYRWSFLMPEARTPENLARFRRRPPPVTHPSTLPNKPS